jgi:hypothetical protein
MTDKSSDKSDGLANDVPHHDLSFEYNNEGAARRALYAARAQLNG